MLPRALIAAGACALAGCGGATAPAPSAGVEVRGDGIRFTLPAGWHAAQRTRTPHLVDPRELLTAGTGRLAAGGHGCNHLPSAALAAMTERDVLVTVEERSGDIGGFPERPRHFDAAAAGPSEAEACAGPQPAFRSHWFEFAERGRGFHVLVAIGRAATAARVHEANALLDSLRLEPPRFDQTRPAAAFPTAGRWRTRVSGPSSEQPRCSVQRVSWASTVAFSDGPQELPPHHMIEALPPDGIIIAAFQYRDRCYHPRGVPVLRPPLSFYTAVRSGFEGPRGDELPLYRVSGRFPGHYMVDVWIFFGRHTPTATQRAAAERELRGVLWPARL